MGFFKFGVVHVVFHYLHVNYMFVAIVTILSVTFGLK